MIDYPKSVGYDRSIMTNTWVVIPAYNEATVIEDTVKGVISKGYKVVVVDDCSSDMTGSRSLCAGAHVCRHMINLGQGAALQTGIEYALRNGAEYIVTFDADGQHDPKDIERVLSPVMDNSVSVTLGSRFIKGSSTDNIPFSKIIILKLATLFSRLSTGLNLTDTHNGFRCFSRDAAQKINLSQNRMAHASEILQQISTNKFTYAEVPVSIRYTEYSIQKGQKISNSFNILWDSMFGALKK